MDKTHVSPAIHQCMVGETCDDIVANSSQFLQVENPAQISYTKNYHLDNFQSNGRWPILTIRLFWYLKLKYTFEIWVVLMIKVNNNQSTW